MKKIALALALVVATGFVSNAVYAATSSNYTVVNNGDKDKKKSKESEKKAEATPATTTSGKSCASATSGKSCCASKK